MLSAVSTDLFAARAPLEWAVIGNGILFTTQIPIDSEGTVVEGGIEAQVRQTLENLCHTLDSVESGTASLTQVLIYVTEREHLATVNAVYGDYIQPPFPNRAAVIVSGFARPDMLIEIVAYAAVDSD